MNSHIMQNQVVNHAVNYILGHVSGEIRVDDVARVCGYSPYYLERLFKAETGEGIYSFIFSGQVRRVYQRGYGDAGNNL